jgi:hypothetical protein
VLTEQHADAIARVGLQTEVAPLVTADALFYVVFLSVPYNYNNTHKDCFILGLTSHVIAAHGFVDRLSAIWATLGRRPYCLFGCLVLPPPPQLDALLVHVARLACMPGHLVLDAVSGAAVQTGEAVAVVVADLAGAAGGREAPVEVVHLSQRRHGQLPVVFGEELWRGTAIKQKKKQHVSSFRN